MGHRGGVQAVVAFLGGIHICEIGHRAGHENPMRQGGTFGATCGAGGIETATPDHPVGDGS